MTKKIGQNVSAADDLMGLWTGHGLAELPMMLNLLYEWKMGGNGVGREVTLVAGDIHIGLQSDIYYGEDSSVVAFQQLTTSAVHNEPCSAMVLKFMSMAAGGFGAADTLCEGW